MKCPICDEEITKISTINQCYDCINHYSKDIFDDAIYETFYYERYGIQRRIINKISDTYHLCFDGNTKAIVPADQLTFDPKHPENIINKIKILTTFA